MISKELKKLGRRELVDIIYQLKVNEQKLQEKITELEESLQEKRIRISMAGSIAEAYYGVSIDMEDRCLEYLSDDLKSVYFAFNTIKKKRVKRENV